MVGFVNIRGKIDTQHLEKAVKEHHKIDDELLMRVAEIMTVYNKSKVKLIKFRQDD